MIDLTAQQIEDAKSNDLEAVTAVIQATEERVMQLAQRNAVVNGRHDADLFEELTQIGRIAVWEAIARFKGADVAQFFTYIDRTVSGVLGDARKTETRQGVSRAVAADFEKALLLAGGDPYKAQEVATSADAMGARKMSPEMAYAAHLAWQGADSLDAPVRVHGGESEPLGWTVADTAGIPSEAPEPRDVAIQRRRVIRDRVHDTLNRLGEQQRHVLKGTYGISPSAYYGTANETELAAAVGVDRSRVRSIRARGHDRFRAIWLQGVNVDQEAA